MRWSMPIMAHYLLDAGMPAKLATDLLAITWMATQGDEDYIGYDSDNGTPSAIGAYGIPPQFRVADWPYGMSKLAADAYILNHIYADGDTNPKWTADMVRHLPVWVYDSAKLAIAYPVAGYVDAETAMQSLIPLPIIPRP